jgi:F-type H+-transporting ATPase subunit delta
MQSKVVAGRYAAALLRSAVTHNELDRVEQDLDLLVRSLAAEATLGRFLDGPRETPATKKQLVEKVFGAKLSPTTIHFFYLLIDKKRLDHLSAIAQMYHEHADEVRGVAMAKVRVAQPLTPEAEAVIKAALKSVTGRDDVRLEVTLDQNVVGGVYLRVGNRIIDYTLQRQLEQLREDIIAGHGPRPAVSAQVHKRVRWKHQQ